MVFGIFSFLLSCETEVDDPPPPQKKVTITGIPSTHNGRYAMAAFGHASNGNILADSDIVTINNGSVILKMYDYNAPAESKKFTESGNYIVILIIGNYTGTTIYWNGGIGPINVTQETTSIPFSSFISLPLSSVSRSFNNRESIMPEIIKQLNLFK
jgi:hypothetical protein